MNTAETSTDGGQAPAEGWQAMALRQMRLQRRLTRVALAQAAGVDERTVEQIESGTLAAPSSDVWSSLIRVLDPNHQFDWSSERARERAFADLSSIDATAQAASGSAGAPDSRPNAVFPVEIAPMSAWLTGGSGGVRAVAEARNAGPAVAEVHLAVQLQDIRRLFEELRDGVSRHLEQLGGSIDERSAERMQLLASDLGDAIQQALHAPAPVPTGQALAVKLAPAHLLDRLEECRADEKTWTAAAVLFVGGTLGVLGGGAVAGSVAAGAWVLCVAFVLAAGVFAYQAWQARRRAEAQKKYMLQETVEPAAAMAARQKVAAR